MLMQKVWRLRPHSHRQTNLYAHRKGCLYPRRMHRFSMQLHVQIKGMWAAAWIYMDLQEHLCLGHLSIPHTGIGSPKV